MVILNFVEKYFKNFLDNIPLVKVNVPTVEKKAFVPDPSALRSNIFAN